MNSHDKLPLCELPLVSGIAEAPYAFKDLIIELRLKEEGLDLPSRNEPPPCLINRPVVGRILELHIGGEVVLRVECEAGERNRDVLLH